MPYSMNNSMWVLVHLSPVSACLIPTTNSMWVHCVFSLSHYVSQTLDPQEVSGTWLCFCQAVSWHLIPWTGGKWLKISALSGSLMSHVLFNDKQEVSDTFLVSGSLIMSHPMTNRMWVTPYFSISTCLTHPMTNSWWVILHLSMQSHHVWSHHPMNNSMWVPHWICLSPCSLMPCPTATNSG